MRNKRYACIIYIDTVLEDKSIRYDFFLSKKIKLATIIYSRYGKRECSNLIASALLSFLISVGIQIEPIFRKKLTKIEKDTVHEIFPFIRQYTGMRSFCGKYEGECAAYPFEEYDEEKVIAESILQEGCGKRQWFCVCGKKGTLFLAGRWQDKSKSNCVVVMNDRVFYSNRDVSEVEQAETDGWLSVDEGALGIQSSFSDLFSALYPDTMLQTYVDSGGRKIFHFLRSRQTDSIFELVAKAGMGVLADELEHFEGLNLSGTKPQDIFGLPIKCLRCINDNYNCISIITPQEREVVLSAYRHSPQTFLRPFTTIDILWLNYCSMARNDTRFDAEKYLFDLEIGKTLHYLNDIVETGEMNSYCAFSLYQNYLMYSARLNHWCCGKYPRNLEKATRKAVDLLNQIYEQQKSRKFEMTVSGKRYQRMMDDESGEKYFIDAPANPEMLPMAGQQLHNCLGNYVKKIANEKVIVGLVYERSENRKLIGAVEIRENILLQAKSFCNADFSGDAREYILRYAKRKWLVIS